MVSFVVWLHVQVFVANPKKPPEVTKILLTNKAKLITYLENFHNERVRKMPLCAGVLGT